MAVVPPLQKVSLEGVAVTVGVGCSVTSKLKGIPGQFVGPGPVGVITYLTTPNDVPVFTNVWLIRLPQEAAQSLNPVMVPPEGAVSMEAVHVKVVPTVAEVMV
jgi:hypothetical protein